MKENAFTLQDLFEQLHAVADKPLYIKGIGYVTALTLTNKGIELECADLEEEEDALTEEEIDLLEYEEFFANKCEILDSQKINRVD